MRKNIVARIGGSVVLAGTIQNLDARVPVKRFGFEEGCDRFLAPDSSTTDNRQVANAEQAIFGKIWSRAFRKYVVQLYRLKTNDRTSTSALRSLCEPF